MSKNRKEVIYGVMILIVISIIAATYIMFFSSYSDSFKAVLFFSLSLLLFPIMLFLVAHTYLLYKKIQD